MISMKKIIILSLLLAFTASSFGQQSPPKQRWTGTDYLQKSKKQKKTGSILLAGGAGLIITAFIIPRGKLVHDGICIGAYCSDKYKNDGIKSAFFIAGSLSSLGSIPFFIASRKNKKRANATSFIIDIEKVPMFQYATRKSQSFPVIGLRLGL